LATQLRLQDQLVALLLEDLEPLFEPGIELNRAAETRLHLNRNAMAAYGLSARETFVASRCWFKSASFFP
jgi:hypothetical protein